MSSRRAPAVSDVWQVSMARNPLVQEGACRRANRLFLWQATSLAVSIQSVEQRAAQVERAREASRASEQALHEECAAATTAGVPIAAVARAAGVTRVTMYAWLAEVRS